MSLIVLSKNDLHLPPAFLELSYNSIGVPTFVAKQAADKPEIPAPIICTLEDLIFTPQKKF